ncbi:MAG: pilus assembly PilX N-terminal domain-containing protein [Deltaproteobacteria bacterium]|jgi:hypothetical protein
MKKMLSMLNNEQGSVLIVSLLTLALLTLIGVAATTTTTSDMHVAGNEKSYKLAFYAAEAARGYVAASPALYGPNNITVGGNLYFPNNGDPSEEYSLGTSPSQSFHGDVEYIGATPPPRGSGFQVGKFKAHRYAMTISGHAILDAESEIEAGFYRIGF